LTESSLEETVGTSSPSSPSLRAEAVWELVEEGDEDISSYLSRYAAPLRYPEILSILSYFGEESILDFLIDRKIAVLVCFRSDSLVFFGELFQTDSSSKNTLSFLGLLKEKTEIRRNGKGVDAVRERERGPGR
jgi:hypothetical protein